MKLPNDFHLAKLGRFYVAQSSPNGMSIIVGAPMYQGVFEGGEVIEISHSLGSTTAESLGVSAIYGDDSDNGSVDKLLGSSLGRHCIAKENPEIVSNSMVGRFYVKEACKQLIFIGCIKSDFAEIGDVYEIRLEHGQVSVVNLGKSVLYGKDEVNPKYSIDRLLALSQGFHCIV
ncbi:hypothetical protein VB319_25430 [Vibrio parahaemolyticus]|uniref:hypothetical protein n=1 Tax=Vibrio parahaemolyticus TaxID=670 RepID=UPI002B1F31E3|nr:hypothetical protein [Vibrio parahaemolyticus]MEA5357273.1 hypothetical protein [Vibrio parahaemolyticus]